MNQLELRVFNVGHGLSVALIERPENYVTLIDLGAETGWTPLKLMKLSLKLYPDVLYITHPHADHLDDVETALEEKFRPAGLFYQDYDWEDVKKREKKELAYKVDDFLKLQKKVPFRKYGGNGQLDYWRYTPADAKKNFGEATYVNNSSLFLVYKWKTFKIAVAGDLESDGNKNGFPTDWVAKMGKPYVSIISVQERDQSVDSRYRSSEFAKGVPFGGETRYALTTRSDGSILVTMWYGTDGKAKWEFESF